MRNDDALGGAVPPNVSADELLRFEHLLSDLSADFIDLPPAQIEPAIHGSLGRIVEALRIDRCTLNRVFPLTGWIEVTHSFAVEGVEPVPKSLPARSVNPWIMSNSLRNLPSVFERLDDLPPEASLDKESFRRIGLKSHVTMPIVVAGELHGSLSFGCVRAERTWPASLLARIRLLTEVFGSALARKQVQEELDIAIGFERLATGILASLAMTRRSEQAGAITAGLQQIGEFVGAERVALWERLEGEARFVPAGRWISPGFDAAPDIDAARALQWIHARVAAGESVRLARIAELPPQAQGDAAALAAAGVRSLLVVPISVSGRNAGALSMASIRREHEWPKALMPGVALLAEVFATLHAREVTERRKLAAEVEAAHWRERLAHLVRIHTAGEMSVALAHEIAQPLGAIGNYANAARRRLDDAAPDLPHVIELIDKLIGQTVRAGEVVTRMRSITQQHEFEPKSIDVGSTIRECASIVKMDCEKRGIRVRMAVARALPFVAADEVHLQQVALNLLRNAMEAIEASGDGAGAREIDVGVRLQDPGGDLLVEIADRGPGIAEGDTERIFESFYSTKSSGLGVGLAICRKLIEAHGGKLWASHRPGGGAVFRFTLPTESFETASGRLAA